MGEWPEIVAAVARTLGVSPTPPLLTDLRHTGVYSDFFGETLGSATSPRKSRHPLFGASELMIKLAHVDGTTIGFELAFRIRRGFTRILWVALEVFPLTCSARLRVAASPSELAP